MLDSRWGLDQGFDHYSDRFDLSKYKVVNLGTVQKKGDEVMDLALEWLEGVKARKFFAWVHLYDPHTPYEPPEPFLSRYPGQTYLGEVAYTDQVVGRLVSWLKGAGVWDRTILVLLSDHGESLGEHGENAAHLLRLRRDAARARSSCARPGATGAAAARRSRPWT